MNDQPDSPKMKAMGMAVALLVWLMMAGLAFGLLVLVLKGVGMGVNSWQYSKLPSLHQAACDGNVARCEQLVKGGVAVDTTDNDGETALSWAIYHRKIDVVRKLIDLGADVNHIDKRPDGPYTPLMFTAWPFRGHNLSGTQEERNAIARLLIERGADVNRATASGDTALHFAVKRNPGLVRMLLAAGANRNVKTKQGYTPLDIAKFSDYSPNDEVIAALQQPAQ